MFKDNLVSVRKMRTIFSSKNGTTDFWTASPALTKTTRVFFDLDFTTSFQNTDCIFCSTRLYWIYSLRGSTFDATEE